MGIDTGKHMKGKCECECENRIPIFRDELNERSESNQNDYLNLELYRILSDEGNYFSNKTCEISNHNG